MQLNTLINLLFGQLKDQDRQKITTLCLIDLHARDVVTKMLNLKVKSTRLNFLFEDSLLD